MNAQTVNISLPKKLLTEVDKQAKREARSRSELLREAARIYLRRMTAWDEIFRYGKKIGKKMGIKSEEDVYRMIQEYRQGK